MWWCFLRCCFLCCNWGNRWIWKKKKRKTFVLHRTNRGTWKRKRNEKWYNTNIIFSFFFWSKFLYMYFKILVWWFWQLFVWFLFQGNWLLQHYAPCNKMFQDVLPEWLGFSAAIGSDVHRHIFVRFCPLCSFVGRLFKFSWPFSLLLFWRVRNLYAYDEQKVGKMFSYPITYSMWILWLCSSFSLWIPCLIVSSMPSSHRWRTQILLLSWLCTWICIWLL